MMQYLDDCLGSLILDYFSWVKKNPGGVEWFVGEKGGLNLEDYCGDEKCTSYLYVIGCSNFLFY